MITGAYAPELSGAGLQCRSLVRRLRDAVDFTVLTTTIRRDLPVVDNDDGIPIRRVFVDPRSVWSKAAALARAAGALVQTRRRSSILHLHGFSQKSMLVMLAGLLTGRPSILKLTSVGHDDPMTMRARGGVAWWFYSRATRFVGVSSALRSSYEQSGLAPGRFRLIPNGVDTSRFRPASEDERQRLCHELGVPDDGPAVLFVGFFSREKHPDALFEAWSRLARSRTDVGPLIFIGATQSTYYEIDAGLAARIRRRAAELGLERRVIFVEQTTRIEEYYRAVRMFVLPSAREGLPNALLEALASGLACVASRLAGVTDDLIEDGVTGRLVPAGDVAAIEAAISFFLDHPDEMETVGRRARASVMARFSLDDVAAMYAGLYRELANHA